MFAEVVFALCENKNWKMSLLLLGGHIFGRSQKMTSGHLAPSMPSDGQKMISISNLSFWFVCRYVITIPI